MKLGAFAIAALVVASSSSARAEGVDKASAQVLFEEGRTLLEAGELDAACARFDQSQRLDPASGTLLNLALCHERAGRIATAWVTYHEAIGAAVRDGRTDREVFARDHIEALRPRLPRIVVRGEPCTGCEVRLDGRVIDGALVKVPTPVDPGEHRLVVRTSGGVESTPVARLAREGETVTLDLPIANGTAVTGSGVGVRLTTTEQPTSARRTAAFASLGVAAVSMGAGVYFGARAVSLAASADETCPTSACTDANAVDQARRADTNAWIANGAIGAAIVAGAVGVYLLVTSRPPAASIARDALSGRVAF